MVLRLGQGLEVSNVIDKVHILLQRLHFLSHVVITVSLLAIIVMRDPRALLPAA